MSQHKIQFRNCVSFNKPLSPTRTDNRYHSVRLLRRVVMLRAYRHPLIPFGNPLQALTVKRKKWPISQSDKKHPFPFTIIDRSYKSS